MSDPEKSPYYIKQGTVDDWRAWKFIRLEALQSDPQFFGSTYEKEVAYTDEEWKSGFHSKRGAFLLFHNNEVIGLTVIRRHDEKPEQANLYASYIRKEHRGKGLSGLLYQARIDWAQENGIEQILVSHRKGNEASKGANQKFGFKFSHEEMQTWPDGTSEEDVCYVLDIQPKQTSVSKLILKP